MADVHLRLSQYEAKALREVLGRLTLADTSQAEAEVCWSAWSRLGHALQPVRAQVRRADPPRREGTLV